MIALIIVALYLAAGFCVATIVGAALIRQDREMFGKVDGDSQVAVAVMCGLAWPLVVIGYGMKVAIMRFVAFWDHAEAVDKPTAEREQALEAARRELDRLDEVRARNRQEYERALRQMENE